jgi:hypothetical protein
MTGLYRCYTEIDMYNLLVTAAEGAWDLPAYEYARTRFLEYTAESLKTKFQSLDASALEELKSLPTLFTYEGDDEPVRVGYIRLIRVRGRSVLIEEHTPLEAARMIVERVRLNNQPIGAA